MRIRRCRARTRSSRSRGSAGRTSGAVLLSVDVQPALARIEPLAGARVLTRIQTPDGRHWGAGRCHFINALGGRVAVLAATTPADLARSDEGRSLLHATIRFLEGEQAPTPSGERRPRT